MRYVSTRGQAAPISFREAVVSGLASDGGLFVPETWPEISREHIDRLASAPFDKVVARSLAAFLEDADDAPSLKHLEDVFADAYASFTASPATPLREIGENLFVLELFHGPTLAFKDVAMQALSALYPWALAEAASGSGDAAQSTQNLQPKKTILAATSGDTGGAAIAAFAGKPGVEMVVLHPKGRISSVQRRIMTTVDADNIHNFAIEGTFDDCQRIVKSLFVDEELKAARDLGGVNSINWVRLAVQTSYYFSTAAALGEASYVVPTGNFGDVFAGFVAKKMGVPIKKLAVAVNDNDIVARAINGGDYSPSGVNPTTSPSMDIQVASNFERLLFEASGRDADRVRQMMGTFDSDRGLQIPSDVLTRIQEDFVAGRADRAAVDSTIRDLQETADYLVDPHTAVGVHVARHLKVKLNDGPVVVLGTAHPAKFPDTVESASGVMPALPEHYADLHQREEFYETLPSDLSAVRNAILAL